MKTFARIGQAMVSRSINFNQAPPEFTVAITGQPRGGTSMVAAVVEALGVYLGPKNEMDEFHFEDQTMHNPDLSQVYPCIASRDAEFARWGWKDPSGMDSIRNILFAIRNPRVIVVFRDILATIDGEMRFDEAMHVQNKRSLMQLADMFVQRQAKILDYVSKTKVPTLLVSYERAMENPAMFVEDVIGFLKIDAEAELRQAALERIGRGYIIPNQG